MNGTIYQNVSSNNVLNKDLRGALSVDFVVKDRANIAKPVLEFRTNHDLTDYNYIYVPGFNRYYYIIGIEVIAQDTYTLYCKSDPLMSFRADIMNLPVLLANTEKTGINSYLPGEIYKQTVKYKTDILNFSSGLLDTGEFILITAGG